MHRTDFNDFHTYDFNRTFFAVDSAAKTSISIQGYVP